MSVTIGYSFFYALLFYNTVGRVTYTLVKVISTKRPIVMGNNDEQEIESDSDGSDKSVDLEEEEEL